MSATSRHFRATDTLTAIAESLAENHHSCALICEDGVPTGIITERDVVRLFTAVCSGVLQADVAVGNVMTSNPICLESDVELADALSISKSHHLRHIPVVDSEQQLIGIVTLTDMVKAYLATLEQKNQLEDENKELHLLAIEDSLTELPNRRAMEIDLRHSDAVSRRNQKSYSVGLIDLDNFKGYNDHYGHQAGDSALQFLAGVLKQSIRGSDKVYRYGGEEFLFLMPGTDLEGAEVATERLRKSIADANYEHVKNPPGHLTVSIGIAENNGKHWNEVVRNADKALYAAKSAGRNTVSADCSADCVEVKGSPEPDPSVSIDGPM